MFSAVKPLSKYLQAKSVRIYDGVFTLHAKGTFVLLLGFTILLSSKQYFGDPVVCYTDGSNKDFVTSHCWTLGLYIHNYENVTQMDTRSKVIAESYRRDNHKPIEEHLLLNALGLGGQGSKPVFLRYYQWVVPVLMLQSIIFYMPAFLWKKWESGRMRNLCANLDDALASPDKISGQLVKLAKYFSADHQDTHMRYFVGYVFCEVFNLTISIVNMLLLNVFLHNFWSHYIKALAAVPSYDWNEWNLITTRIFPKLAKCEILKYGSSGSLESHDYLCLLPLNTLNEKIFVFLWLWYIIMALLAALKLIYRLLIIFYPGLRLQLLRCRSRFTSISMLKRILKDFSCADWFMMMRVGNNIGPELFNQLVGLLGDKKWPTLEKDKLDIST